MKINYSFVEKCTSTDVQHSNADIRSGQIWLDGHRLRKKRAVLVLDVTGEKIVCQGLPSSKITSIRREQFNRGANGLFYAGNLPDMCIKHIMAQAQKVDNSDTANLN